VIILDLQRDKERRERDTEDNERDCMKEIGQRCRRREKIRKEELLVGEMR